MVNTSRLYEILVQEREREEKEEKSKESAFKRVKKKVSKRWTIFGKKATGENEAFHFDPTGRNICKKNRK